MKLSIDEIYSNQIDFLRLIEEFLNEKDLEKKERFSVHENTKTNLNSNERKKKISNLTEKILNFVSNDPCYYNSNEIIKLCVNFMNNFSELLYLENSKSNLLGEMYNKIVSKYEEINKGLLKDNRSILRHHKKYTKDYFLEIINKDEELRNISLNFDKEISGIRKKFNNKYVKYYKPFEDILYGKSKITKNEKEFAYSMTNSTFIEKMKKFPAFLVFCFRNKDDKEFKLIFPDIDFNSKDKLHKIYRRFIKAKLKFDKYPLQTNKL